MLDLFAGVGGLSFGFEIIRGQDGVPVFELVCAVEKDEYACNTLRANLIEQGRDPSVVLQADLTDPKTHADIIERCGGSVDIIIGGPPCQSFSYIGPRSGSVAVRKKYANDGRDRLYEEYIALVRELEPKFLVFENVSGILTKKDACGRNFIDLITGDIAKCGYTLGFENSEEPYVVLNAADYGVPQTRRRVFVIANRLGERNPIPLPTHSEDAGHGTLPYVTVWDAIGDLPPVLSPITMWNIPETAKERIRAENGRRYRGAESVPFHLERFQRHRETLGVQGRRFLDFVRPPGDERPLTAHIARGHQLSDIELFEKMPPGSTSKDIFYGDDPHLRKLRELIKYNMDSFLDKYRKQSWDRPSTTIYAHMRKDGNRFIHPDSSQARSFTVREAARLQSFPDSFLFTAPGNVRYQYIGNAVPPLLSQAIARAIRQVLLAHQARTRAGVGGSER